MVLCMHTKNSATLIRLNEIKMGRRRTQQRHHTQPAKTADIIGFFHFNKKFDFMLRYSFFTVQNIVFSKKYSLTVERKNQIY